MSELTEGHTIKRYDGDLARLRLHLLEMGGLVLDQVARAVDAFVNSDTKLAHWVIERDHVVNGYNVRVDEESIALIAMRQPVAGDLRTIMSITKAVTDLERIGDEAEKIARMAVRVAKNDEVPARAFYQSVRSMADLVSRMLRDCLDAFDQMSVDKAREAAGRDREVDAQFRKALKKLAKNVMRDARHFRFATSLVFAIKALERIGDHAKNISEYVVYLVEGTDARHVTPASLPD